MFGTHQVLVVYILPTRITKPPSSFQLCPRWNVVWIRGPVPVQRHGSGHAYGLWRLLENICHGGRYGSPLERVGNRVSKSRYKKLGSVPVRANKEQRSCMHVPSCASQIHLYDCHRCYCLLLMVIPMGVCYRASSSRVLSTLHKCGVPPQICHHCPLPTVERCLDQGSCIRTATWVMEAAVKHDMEAVTALL